MLQILYFILDVKWCSEGVVQNCKWRLEFSLIAESPLIASRDLWGVLFDFIGSYQVLSCGLWVYYDSVLFKQPYDSLFYCSFTNEKGANLILSSFVGLSSVMSGCRPNSYLDKLKDFIWFHYYLLFLIDVKISHMCVRAPSDTHIPIGMVITILFTLQGMVTD